MRVIHVHFKEIVSLDNDYLNKPSTFIICFKGVGDVLYKPYEDLLHRVDFQEKHSFDIYEVIALCIKESRFQEKRKSVDNISISLGSKNY